MISVHSDHGTSRPLAFVTGAAGAIGTAICRELAQHNYFLIACDRHIAALEELQRTMDAPCEIVLLDLTDASTCAAAMQQVAERHGRLDVFINNAVTWFIEAFVDSTDEHWGEVPAVNVVAPARLSRLALPLLRNSKHPKIIMMGGKNGLRGEPMPASHDVSKAALVALTRSLASEFRRFDILVNWLHRLIHTESNKTIIENAEHAAIYRKRIPLMRFGAPEEVARTVAFLWGRIAPSPPVSPFFWNGGQMAGKPM
jgi:NAD(P)-dependent dehydrogenase (short-subunit alcohol dehydrogenase family)